MESHADKAIVYPPLDMFTRGAQLFVYGPRTKQNYTDFGYQSVLLYFTIFIIDD